MAGLEGSIKQQQSYRSAGFSVGIFNNGHDISEQGRVPPKMRTNWKLEATGNQIPRKVRFVARASTLMCLFVELDWLQVHAVDEVVRLLRVEGPGFL